MKECCERLSRSVYWQLFTGLSGQLIGPIFKAYAFFSHCFNLENGNDWVHQKSIHDYQHTTKIEHLTTTQRKHEISPFQKDRNVEK
jgi:hypothetical protein